MSASLAGAIAPTTTSTFDVVVVGGGGSGLSAAIVAATAGLRVVLLEKNQRLGGSTGLSVGSFSAAGTSLQARHEIKDSEVRFVSDIKEMNGGLEVHENEALREVLVAGAAASFEWLRTLGVQFLGPSDQPHFTASRMHQVVPNSRAYISALRAAALRAHVDIQLGVRAEKLLRDEAGRVIGVHAGAEFLATRGVILAAGDYSASADMKSLYASADVGRLPPINPTNTGDGFAMALEVGAGVRNMWRVLDDLRFVPPQGVDIAKALPHSVPSSVLMRIAIERLPRFAIGWFARRALTSWVAPSRALFAEGAILVNALGNRFADELSSPARRLGDEPGHVCYLVMDSATADKFRQAPNPISTFPGVTYAYLGDYLRLRPDVTHVAPTVEALAQRMHVDPSALQRTVDDYNTAVNEGVDRRFGRSRLGPGLRKPPYVAMGPMLGRIVITDGGVAINERCQVLDESGTRIAGLYAVGATGQGGLLLKAHGLHLAWAVTSGRIAGQAMTQEPS